MSEHTDADGENSSAIDAAVVERVAGRESVPVDELASALVVVGADLTDAHSEYEREYEYTVADGRRIYAADTGAWRAVVERNDLGGLAAPVRAAHRAQADALLADGATPDAPVVVGVDTAEAIDEAAEAGSEER